MRRHERMREQRRRRQGRTKFAKKALSLPHVAPLYSTMVRPTRAESSARGSEGNRLARPGLEEWSGARRRASSRAAGSRHEYLIGRSGGGVGVGEG